MQVSADVLLVLGRSEIDGNAIRLVGQLDRALYTKTDKVLSAAGGSWNRKAKAHVFSEDPTSAIEQIILTGEIMVPTDFGYFPTPAVIVDRLIELAQLESDMDAFEPSAGQGAIAVKVAKRCAAIDCVELLPKNIEVLRSLGIARRVIEGDFMAMAPTPVFDVIVMNPPFERQNDIRHVTHALKFLKPRGRLVSVMAAGVLFRENKIAVEFREMLSRRGGTIEENPEGSFRESGTLVRTVNVSIQN